MRKVPEVKRGVYCMGLRNPAKIRRTHASVQVVVANYGPQRLPGIIYKGQLPLLLFFSSSDYISSSLIYYVGQL